MDQESGTILINYDCRNSYGMYFHIMNMSFYLLFLTLITINALKLIDVTHASQMNDSYPRRMIHNMVTNSEASQYQAKFVNCFSMLILLFVVLNIIKEFYQIYHQVKK